MDNFPYHLIDSMSFNKRPEPIPASLRPIYRVTLILLILKLNCSKGTASLLKIYFFNWVLKSKSLQDYFFEASKKRNCFTLGLIHLDPMINLALRIAIAENLVTINQNAKYSLTNKGTNYLDGIFETFQDFLADEMQVLSAFSTKISEVKLNRDLGLQ